MSYEGAQHSCEDYNMLLLNRLYLKLTANLEMSEEYTHTRP